MDTVSWLSFFTASGLGAALGVLSLTALIVAPTDDGPVSYTHLTLPTICSV